MWRVFWSVAALLAVLAGFVVWVASTTTFLYRHPRLEGVRVVIDRTTGAAVVDRPPQPVTLTPVSQASGSRPQLQPRVEAAETEFNFGIMDPLTMGRHEFVLRNVGTAPLKLHVGPTTCKCTVSGLDRSDVPPGGQAVVTLEWNTGRTMIYSHAATIYTSDPNRRSVEVRVTGKVRLQLGVDIPEITFSDLNPDEPAQAERLIYTRLWDNFEIQSIHSQLAGFGWEVADVSPDQAPQLEATALKRLRITLPAAGLKSRFADTLRICVKVAGQDAPEALDVPIAGNVQGRFTLYGSAIEEGAVHLGSVAFGKGKSAKVLLKIRDREPRLDQPELEIVPAVVRAQLSPHPGATPHGLYDLHVELPADTPPCQYLGTPQIDLTIKTGHPRVGDIHVPIRLAVVERD